MDYMIQMMIINDNYEAYMETENYQIYSPYDGSDISSYELGGEYDLTNQLTQAIRGYVDLDDLDEAVPTSVTINQLPSCGILWRETMSEDEESFAVFWSYDSAEGWVVEVEEGEVIDFSNTALFYEGSDDCGELEEEFIYSIMG